MSAPLLFDRIAEMLDEMTDLSRLESRGTLRIMLKKAGFEVGAVSAPELAVVIAKLLPAELVARGIGDSERVAQALVDALVRESACSESPEPPETPDAVFRRITS